MRRLIKHQDVDLGTSYTAGFGESPTYIYNEDTHGHTHPVTRAIGVTYKSFKCDIR